MRIFLATDGSAGLKAAKLVARTGHALAGIAAPHTPANAPLIRFAESSEAAVFPGTIVKDASFAEWLIANGVDVLLSVHTSFLMHHAVLAAAQRGAFNLHPGPLPRYAGRNPVSWALFNGESQHAASLHWMVPEIDAGPITSIKEVEIDPEDRALELMAKTSAAGLIAVRELLERLADGRPINRIDQSVNDRRYFSAKDIPLGGLPHWDFPADSIVRYFRANNFGPFPSPWPKPLLRIGGRDLEVFAVELESRLDGEPAGTVKGSRVAASDYWLSFSARERQE